MQWFATYSRLLSDYMRRDKGIGMDLTLVSQCLELMLQQMDKDKLHCGLDNSQGEHALGRMQHQGAA